MPAASCQPGRSPELWRLTFEGPSSRRHGRSSHRLPTRLISTSSTLPPWRWPEGPLRITSLAQTTGCGPEGPPEMATTLCPSRNEKALKVTSQELQSEADLPLGQNTHHVRSWGKGQPTHQSPGHTWSTLWGRGASFLLPPASSGWSSIRLA